MGIWARTFGRNPRREALASLLDLPHKGARARSNGPAAPLGAGSTLEVAYGHFLGPLLQDPSHLAKT